MKKTHEEIKYYKKKPLVFSRKDLRKPSHLEKVPIKSMNANDPNIKQADKFKTMEEKDEKF